MEATEATEVTVRKAVTEQQIIMEVMEATEATVRRPATERSVATEVTVVTKGTAKDLQAVIPTTMVAMAHIKDTRHLMADTTEQMEALRVTRDN